MPWGGDRYGFEVVAISLRDGKRLWTRSLHLADINLGGPIVAVGDLDRDGRCEVVVTHYPRGLLVAETLEGRDGTSRWSWSRRTKQQPKPYYHPSLRLADLDGDGSKEVCVCTSGTQESEQVIVLDALGKERSRRDLPRRGGQILSVADMNGDGRDELLLDFGGRMHAVGNELSDLWSQPIEGHSIERVIPSSPDKSSVILTETRSLDGESGRPRWSGYRSPVRWPKPLETELLDQGSGRRPPFLLTRGMGMTVCRASLPTDSRGAYEPPHGALVSPGLAGADPRWERPLPWTTWAGGALNALNFLTVGGLALLNVVLPLAIIRLAARRRPWSIRVMMALPVAVAAPLTALLTIEPSMLPNAPLLLLSPSILFGLGTVAGLPVVIFAGLILASAFRLRWRRLALVVALTFLVTVAIGACWLWFDMPSMPAIEHYERSGWEMVILVGAYSVGAGAILAWSARGSFRLARKFSRGRSNHLNRL